MKVQEFFEKGEQVWVLTPEGLRRGNYNGVYSLSHISVNNIDNYSRKSQEFPLNKVFPTCGAAHEYLYRGEQYSRKVENEIISLYDEGDVFWEIERGEIVSHRIDKVVFRMGQFEYFGTWGGCAKYLERYQDHYFRTREEAVRAYLSM